MDGANSGLPYFACCTNIRSSCEDVDMQSLSQRQGNSALLWKPEIKALKSEKISTVICDLQMRNANREMGTSKKPTG